MSSLRASSIALSASTRASASDCWRPFSTIPASRSATALSWATSDELNVRGSLGLDVEHADGLVVPGQRHAQHRGDEPALVDAADPQEARVGLDIGDDQRLLMGRDAAGHALAERHAGPADLEPVEPVRGGERQVRSVPVEQVQRGDIGVERVPRPVDDRLEELVPGARRRGEPGDLVDEAELLELVGGTGAAVLGLVPEIVPSCDVTGPPRPGGGYRSVADGRRGAIGITIQG